MNAVKNFASFRGDDFEGGPELLEHNTQKGRDATERQKKKNTVCVSIRSRPTNKHEQASVESQQAVWIKPGLDGDQVTVDLDGEMKTRGYDNGFEDVTQEEVFDVIGKPMLKCCFMGFNATIFAYGQTGAGKTFSVMGKEEKLALPNGGEQILGYSWGHPVLEGFVPRFVRTLLWYGKYLMSVDPGLEVKLIMSAMQVYLEEVQDLLEKRSGSAYTPLNVTGSLQTGFYPQGLSYHNVDTEARAKVLIETCLKGRALGSHSMNNSSSRSHCIIGFRLLQTGGKDGKDKDSQIYIVDLAGSERIAKVGVEPGSQMAKEAAFINQSLTTLRQALEDVAKGKKSGNIRNSKLTMILSNSFGGNSKTWMLCCCSPAKMNASETFSTLNFADIVKKIVNVPKENVVSKKQVMDTMQMVQSLQESNKALEDLNGQLTEENTKLLEELKQLREGGGGGGGGGYAPAGVAAGGGGGGPVLGAKADLFIGRATLSLKNVVLGKHSILTLPLETQEGQEGALLNVSTWVPKVDDQEPPQYPDVSSALNALSGRRFDFCVLVSAAENIPEPYTGRVVCRYYFKKKENKPVSTVEASGSNPRWDFNKRYAFPDFAKDLCDWLC
eukprot:EG_transcript_7234